MLDLLYSRVRKATGIHARYRAHASYRSMDVFLDDWQATYDLLGRRIATLQILRDERKREVEAGEWPPGLTGTPGGSDG